MLESLPVDRETLKIGGGVLLLIVSLGLFFHRLPNTQYAAVHPDDPRPKVRPLIPAANATVIEAPPPKPENARPAAPVASAAGAPPAQAEDMPARPENLEDACAAEIGILCYRVEQGRLAGCLSGYEDSLRQSCLKALRKRTAP